MIFTHLKGEMKMPEIKINYDDEIFKTSYYKKMLEDMNNIIIMDDSKYHRHNIVIDLLNANAFRQSPAILVTNQKKIIDKVKYVLEHKYDFVEPEYKDIKDVNKDVDINQKKAFIFDINKKGFELTLELAMMLNSKLTRVGCKPILIIECFDEIYNEELDETTYEYLKDVLFKNLHVAQNVAVMSKLSLLWNNISGRIDGNKLLVQFANGIIVSKGYLYDDDMGLKEKRIDEFEKAINAIPNRELMDMAFNEFESITFKLSMDGQEEKLKEGFVLNINEGKIGEFLV